MRDYPLWQHPGGPQYIDNYVGDDGTIEFLESHPLDIIERTMSPEDLKAAIKGTIDKSVRERPTSLPSSSSPSTCLRHALFVNPLRTVASQCAV